MKFEPVDWALAVLMVSFAAFLFAAAIGLVVSVVASECGL